MREINDILSDVRQMCFLHFIFFFISRLYFLRLRTERDVNAYSLSELLYMPMPTLPTQSQKSDSINISSGGQGDSQDVIFSSGGRWEDEEERKFFEDIQDLRDFVPKSVLGIDEKDVVSETAEVAEDKEKERKDRIDVSKVLLNMYFGFGHS